MSNNSVNRSQVEIDMKEITFSKYFNMNNVSQFSSDRLNSTNASTPTKYQILQVVIKEARFNKLETVPSDKSSWLSYVVIVYGSQRFQTKLVLNDQLNPRWHETFNIEIGYQGLLFFPDTVEIMVLGKKSTSQPQYVIGKNVLSLREILAETTHIDDWICLVDHTQITGSISLSAKFLKSPQAVISRDERYSQSCYDKTQTIQKKFFKNDIQGKPINEQLVAISLIVQHHKESSQKVDIQKTHPKSHGSIVSKYLQNNYKQSNNEYFSEYNYGAVTQQQKIAKINAMMDNIRTLYQQTQHNQQILQKLNQQNLASCEELNNKQYILQNLKAELQQLIENNQTLKEQMSYQHQNKSSQPQNQREIIMIKKAREKKQREEMEQILAEKIQVAQRQSRPVSLVNLSISNDWDL